MDLPTISLHNNHTNQAESFVMALAAPPPTLQERRTFPEQAKGSGRNREYVIDHITRASPWFIPRVIPDAEAADMLCGAPNGCFIVRLSSLPNAFILSFS